MDVVLTLRDRRLACDISATTTAEKDVAHLLNYLSLPTGAFAWTPGETQQGTQAVTFTATANGEPPLTVSETVTLTVNAPTVTLTSPPVGAILAAPATVRLRVAADNPDGTVVKVEFFRGDTRLGEDTAAPFEFEVARLVAGEYSFSARARDDAEATAGSPAATIAVAVAFTVVDLGPNGTVHLELGGELGAAYEVATSTNLDGWTHVTDTTSGPDDAISYADTPHPPKSASTAWSAGEKWTQRGRIPRLQ